MASGEDAARVPVPEPSEAAVRFHRSGLWIWAFAQSWSIAVPVAVVASGLAARIRDRAERWSPWRPGAVAIAAVLFLAVLFLANLPLRYYAGYVRLHAYGLSQQSLGRWLGHSLMRLGILMATAAAILPGPYYLLRRTPRRWWLYTGLASVPVAAFFAWVMPIVIDPLFHDFKPLENRPLAARIEALARRANLVGARIEQVEMSRDTTTVNAYVTGLFGSKRVVLWDTLLDRFEDDQILAIVGHEMGHYVLNHVAVGVGLSAFATIAGLFVLDRAGRALLRRSGPRLGIGGLDDLAALPVLYAIGLAIVLATDPISFAVSRSLEHEADRFALEITRDNHAAASAFLNLQRDNLSVPYPDPFTRIWRSTHPALGDRIEFCNDYHPWRDGHPLKYGGLFRDP